jgi:hypothetical protein
MFNTNIIFHLNFSIKIIYICGKTHPHKTNWPVPYSNQHFCIDIGFNHLLEGPLHLLGDYLFDSSLTIYFWIFSEFLLSYYGSKFFTTQRTARISLNYIGKYLWPAVYATEAEFVAALINSWLKVNKNIHFSIFCNKWYIFVFNFKYSL